MLPEYQLQKTQEDEQITHSLCSLKKGEYFQMNEET